MTGATIPLAHGQGTPRAPGQSIEALSLHDSRK